MHWGLSKYRIDEKNLCQNIIRWPLILTQGNKTFCVCVGFIYFRHNHHHHFIHEKPLSHYSFFKNIFFLKNIKWKQFLSSMLSLSLSLYCWSCFSIFSFFFDSFWIKKQIVPLLSFSRTHRFLSAKTCIQFIHWNDDKILF